MKLQDNEIILFDEFPYQTRKMLPWYIGGLILTIGLDISFYFTKQSPIAFYYEVPFWIFLFFTVSMLFGRITLTNKRILFQTYLFPRKQIFKENLIQPIIYEKSKAELSDKPPKSFWQRKPFETLELNTHEQSLSLKFSYKKPKTDLGHDSHKMDISGLSEQQKTELFKHLVQTWDFAPNHIEYFNPPSLEPVDAEGKPIAQVGFSTFILLGAIVVLLISCMLLLPQLNGLHFGLESYLWIIPCILIAIPQCYWLIKRDQRPHLYFTAIFFGCLIGVVLYMNLLQVNRIYNESYAKTITLPMTFTHLDNGQQVWTFNKKDTQDIGLNQIYLHEKWQYLPQNAEQDKSYQIKIKQGLFNDYFVDQESFEHIKNTVESSR